MAVGLRRPDADRQVAPLLVGGAVAVALVTLVAAKVVGPVGLAFPLGVMYVLACLRWPAVAVASFVGLSLLLDAYYGETPTPMLRFYDGVVGNISPFEILLYLTIGCVALDCVRRRRLPPVPALLGVPLLLMAVAFGVGSMVGYFAGAGIKVQVDGLRNVLPLVAVAPMVAAVVPAERLRAVLGAVVLLIGFKAVVGLVITMQRGGPSLENLVYYEIVMNWLFMVLVLGLLACVVRGVAVPWWVWAATGLALLMFLFGLKRALWLGSVAGIAMILVLGLGRVGRRLLVPAVLVVLALGWLLVSAGFNAELSGPVAERVSSLNPEKVATNTQDRYRLDERANVWLAIKAQPISGLGQGVPWRAVKPLGIEHEDARDYVHFALLWFWMKYSILGALAYVLLMAAAIWTGVRVMRRSADPLMAAAGLGLAGSFLALAVAELTVTWTGTSARFTVMAGAAMGLLAVLDRQARAVER